MRVFVGMLLLAACALAACQYNFERPLKAGEIRGSLQYEAPGSGAKTPASGAKVRLQGTTLGALADAEGVFRFAGVPVGTHTLRAAFVVPGTGTELQLFLPGIEIAAKATGTGKTERNGRDLGTLVLGALSTLSGTVTKNGAPVAGAQVVAQNVVAATTGADGQYALRLPAGQFDLVAVYPDAPSTRVTARTSLNVRADATQDFAAASGDPALGSLSGLAVYASDEGGESHAGIRVRILPAGGGAPIEMGETASGGTFAAPDLPAGVYTVRATATGFRDAYLAPVAVFTGAAAASLVLFPEPQGPDADCDRDGEPDAGDTDDDNDAAADGDEAPACLCDPAGAEDADQNGICDASEAPPPPSGSGDTTPPAVFSTAPANLESGVAMLGNVTATFTEAMDAQTFIGNFTLRDDGDQLVAGTVGVAGAVSTFDPDAALLPLKTYTARVSAAVADLAGNPLGADHDWTFTTAADPSSPRLELFAGSVGGWGNTDGSGSLVRFNHPSGAATDSAGNVYVTDFDNHTVRKITPAGVVSTFAGKAGTFGTADGTGSAARFRTPWGVATDGADNVYVADYQNMTIRKITPAGVVTTFAGAAGACGSADSTAPPARICYPSGVALDSAGNVYTADPYFHTIRMITPAGVVSTLAGSVGNPGSTDATGSAARFDTPRGVATDSLGNVYVAEANNHTIRRVAPGGVVTTFAGTVGVAGSADATGTAASFSTPYGLATDSADNVYVADFGNAAIRKITSGGVVSTLAGLAATAGSSDGAGPAARFSGPYAVATDSADDVYVADYNNHTIRKITAAGNVTTLAGLAPGSGSADGTGAAARFVTPGGAGTDGAGNVYVADSGNGTVRKMTPAGDVTTLAAVGNATGVATDSAGNVYVAQSISRIIGKISPTGVWTTFAGSGANGSTDATGIAASFSYPSGVATDSADNVYVADDFNNTIRMITPAGLVTTFAGTAGQYDSVDGTGAAARFKGPYGVATDSAGNVYVADIDDCTIRKITPLGVVTTLAGSPGMQGTADGTGSAARFAYPSGIAADGEGNVYVVEGGPVVRKVTPSGVVTTVVGVLGQLGFTPGALPGVLHATGGVALSGSSLYITLFYSNGVAVVRNVP